MPSPAPHTPPRRLCRGIPIRFCRRPPPRPRLRREIPVHFCRHPRPTHASVRIPMHFCWQPHRARAFARRYPCTSAGSPHPDRAFARRYLYASASDPTAPAPAALLPRPGEGGGVRARAYIRGAAVPGSFPPIPWHWTVGISPRGVGLTGRGNSFPLPCLLRSQNSEYLTDPVRVPCRWLPKELAGSPHPARACGAPPPPRGRGRGPCPGVYQGSSRARGGAGGPPRPALSHLSLGTGPWGYRHGGWG